MTREEFKYLAMQVLSEQEMTIGRYRGQLFTSDDIDNFKVAQYDEDDYDVEAAMPFEEFLDELYSTIMDYV